MPFSAIELAEALTNIGDPPSSPDRRAGSRSPVRWKIPSTIDENSESELDSGEKSRTSDSFDIRQSQGRIVSPRAATPPRDSLSSMPPLEEDTELFTCPHTLRLSHRSKSPERRPLIKTSGCSNSADPGSIQSDGFEGALPPPIGAIPRTLLAGGIPTPSAARRGSTGSGSPSPEPDPGLSAAPAGADVAIAGAESDGDVASECAADGDEGEVTEGRAAADYLEEDDPAADGLGAGDLDGGRGTAGVSAGGRQQQRTLMSRVRRIFPLVRMARPPASDPSTGVSGGGGGGGRAQVAPEPEAVAAAGSAGAEPRAVTAKQRMKRVVRRVNIVKVSARAPIHSLIPRKRIGPPTSTRALRSPSQPPSSVSVP